MSLLTLLGGKSVTSVAGNSADGGGEGGGGSSGKAETGTTRKITENIGEREHGKKDGDAHFLASESARLSDCLFAGWLPLSQVNKSRSHLLKAAELN